MDALFSPDEPVVIELEVEPLVSKLPTLRCDVLRGDLLGVVSVHFTGMTSL